jgi:formate-dependent nitrite reductase cytochrome c552 subunit
VGKPISWLLWGLLSVALGGYFTYALLADERSQSPLNKGMFLPGKTTHGHYQIELACSACHTPFQGVKQEACLDCHGEALKAAEDSHPKSKFTDPRNADKLAILDALRCITCHREHKPEITHAMDVTLPDDFCLYCHEDIGKEQESHKQFNFQSCATGGCHNYHDNTALYEDFLVKHRHEPRTLTQASVPQRNLSDYLRLIGKSGRPLTGKDQDASPEIPLDPVVLKQWEATAHARAGVNCTDCHKTKGPGAKEAQWQNRPDHTACAQCHEEQVKGFTSSKHGMRLAQKLTPMSPGMARLPMKASARDKQLSCNSCHAAHTFDTRQAAVEACASCHNDRHSLAYKRSPHFRLWQAEAGGRAVPGSGVSCATCHLPREVHRRQGMSLALVQHNQSLNLRPNEKMIRGVCLNCHGLGFSIDVLADAALVQRNFTGEPARHVRSIDMARERPKKSKTSSLEGASMK